MLGVDFGAVGIENRRLHRTGQEIVWVAAEELVERVLARDVDRQPPAAPSGAAPHLPQAGDRAREGHADRGVEIADIDAELKRVGGHHAQQLSATQAALDLLALSRGVTGPVWRYPFGESRLKAVGGVAKDELDALA